MTVMRCIARAAAMNSTDHLAIFVCGPTAVGKTAVAVSLAKWLNTEIISFDSRQLYRELKIGSAPPSSDELKAVRHHFIQSHSLHDNLSAAEYANQALAQMQQLYQKQQNLILVGGSGLYLKALAEGLDDIPAVPGEIRASLNNQLMEEGLSGLQEELRIADPDYHRNVDLENPQRIIRALEVIRYSGQTYSSFRKGKRKKRFFKPVKIGLNIPRDQLYNQINQRVENMIREGLEDEVKSLEDYWQQSPLKTVGYDELVRYFKTETDRKTAIEEIKKNTRRYAKRQLTWFRRDPEIKWFQPEETQAIKNFIRSQSNFRV